MDSGALVDLTHAILYRLLPRLHSTEVTSDISI
jgi:hypothetical protein